jgi:hypothetical protein
LETRAGFRGNHDPVLEAAVQAVLARGAPRRGASPPPKAVRPPSTGAQGKDKSSSSALSPR